MPIVDYDDVLSTSICLHCKYLVSRTIVPVNYEDFGLSFDEIKEEVEEMEGEAYEADEIAILHNTCNILHMDLGHIVLTCNKFEKETGLFTDNPY